MAITYETSVSGGHPGIDFTKAVSGPITTSSNAQLIASVGIIDAGVALAAVQGSSNTAVTFSFGYVQVRVTHTKATLGLNNYQFVTVGDGMSTSEKIR